VSRPEAFNTSLRRGAGEPRDLMARVDAEVRDRIGEAVDFVCLEAMVHARQARALPPPAADSARDRAEFEASVETFLARLGDEISSSLAPEQRESFRAATARATGDPLARLLGGQVALAKLLPDYWQRFETVRAAYAAEVGEPPTASGRDRPRWLDRLLGR
jgi:hypothetical protein